MMLSASQYDGVLENLARIEDPELGVNIVDLGLIYDLSLDDDILTIDMTLTYAGCPLTDIIEDDINDALLGYGWTIQINWVWVPAWTMARISDDGRDQLRAMGLSIDAVHDTHSA